MKIRILGLIGLWLGMGLAIPVEAAKPKVETTRTPVPLPLVVEDEEDDADYEMPREVRESQAIAFYNKAVEHSNNGDHKLAIHLLEMSVAMFPEFEKAHVNLAHAYSRTDKDELALKHLNIALTLDPNDSLAYYGKARLMKKKKNFKEAISLVKQGLKCKKIPKDWKITGQILLGHLYDKSDNVDQAIKETQIALSLGPKDAEAYCNMAIFFAQKMDDQSFEWLRKAEKIEPKAECVRNLKRAIGEE